MSMHYTYLMYGGKGAMSWVMPLSPDDEAYQQCIAAERWCERNIQWPHLVSFSAEKGKPAIRVLVDDHTGLP